MAPPTWREQRPVYVDKGQVGRATSGSWSPTLKQHIALASVEPEFEAAGTPVELEVTVGAGAAAPRPQSCRCRSSIQQGSAPSQETAQVGDVCCLGPNHTEVAVMSFTDRLAVFTLLATLSVGCAGSPPPAATTRPSTTAPGPIDTADFRE